MALAVVKFGGSSLADYEGLGNVCRIVLDLKREYDELVAVVSARGDSTDELLKTAESIADMPTPRELDALLATGEQVSAALLSILLAAKGCAACSLTGAQAGIRTDGSYGAAEIIEIDKSKIKNLLKTGRVAVICGFQGVAPNGDITTLGRGGSDLTAVALAAAMSADACLLYKDVDGVYTADPKIVPDAVKLDRISYDDMIVLARSGSQVLQQKSVELAKKYKVTIEVRPSSGIGRGTLISI